MTLLPLSIQLWYPSKSSHVSNCLESPFLFATFCVCRSEIRSIVCVWFVQGAPPCTFYTRYGICKFGPTCKFDHPLGGLTYSPSASSLADVPVAPYPIGSSPTTLAPSSSSDASREGQMPPLEAAPYPDDHPRGHIHSSRDNSDSAVVSSSTGANMSQNLSTQAGSSEKASSSGQASDSLNGKN